LTSPRTQHLPLRPGSHQQAAPFFCSPQLSALRHLMIDSFSNTGRCAMLMSALMVPGLFTWSVGMAEVSEVPGRACANICHSSVFAAMPYTMISEMRVYWLPTRPLMFSHFGFAGSSGGLSGSNAMWHDPHDVPMRNGGSTEPSCSRLAGASPLFAFLSAALASYPCHDDRLPFNFTHAALSNLGFGNLRNP